MEESLEKAAEDTSHLQESFQDSQSADSKENDTHNEVKYADREGDEKSENVIAKESVNARVECGEIHVAEDKVRDPVLPATDTKIGKPVVETILSNDNILENKQLGDIPLTNSDEEKIYTSDKITDGNAAKALPSANEESEHEINAPDREPANGEEGQSATSAESEIGTVGASVAEVSDNAKISLRIKFLDGSTQSEKRIEVDLGKTEAEDLRHMIADEFEVDSSRIRLIFKGKVIKDGTSALAYGLTDNDTIHAVARPEGVPSSNTSGPSAFRTDAQTRATLGQQMPSSNPLGPRSRVIVGNLRPQTVISVSRNPGRTPVRNCPHELTMTNPSTSAARGLNSGWSCNHCLRFSTAPAMHCPQCDFHLCPPCFQRSRDSPNEENSNNSSSTSQSAAPNVLRMLNSSLNAVARQGNGVSVPAVGANAQSSNTNANIAQSTGAPTSFPQIPSGANVSAEAIAELRNLETSARELVPDRVVRENIGANISQSISDFLQRINREGEERGLGQESTTRMNTPMNTTNTSPSQNSGTASIPHQTATTHQTATDNVAAQARDAISMVVDQFQNVRLPENETNEPRNNGRRSLSTNRIMEVMPSFDRSLDSRLSNEVKLLRETIDRVHQVSAFSRAPLSLPNPSESGYSHELMELHSLILALSPFLLRTSLNMNAQDGDSVPTAVLKKDMATLLKQLANVCDLVAEKLHPAGVEQRRVATVTEVQASVHVVPMEINLQGGVAGIQQAISQGLQRMNFPTASTNVAVPLTASEAVFSSYVLPSGLMSFIAKPGARRLPQPLDD